MAFIGLALLTGKEASRTIRDEADDLLGNPITGALLDPPNYTWSHAVTFSGVHKYSAVTSRVLTERF